MNTKQVDKSHYEFGKYVNKRRWASMWHQLDEVIKLKPERVLEIGPGPGLFKAMARTMQVHVETLDLDPDLKPDHVASAFEMPFQDAAYDVVCAFQVLEHLPFQDSEKAFQEMARVARTAVVISLPDAATRWPISIHIPRVGTVTFSIPKPRFWAPLHHFKGEHYWELNKAGYHPSKVVQVYSEKTHLSLERTFRVPEHPYHRFLIFTET